MECCEENIYYSDSEKSWVFAIERGCAYDDDGYLDIDTYVEEYPIGYCPYCGKLLNTVNGRQIQ